MNMNFIKQMTICGISAITLSSAAVSASSQPVPNFQKTPDFLDVVLMQMAYMGKPQISIKNDTVAHSGFDPQSFTIHLPKDNAKLPAYCGYDEKTNKIVPIKLSSAHMLFEALAEAMNYMSKITNDGIFEHLYGKNDANIFKLLWENPYGTPEAKLTALTGFIYDKATENLKIDKISTMLFDAEEFLKSQATGPFVPRVFSVTYDRFLQIQAQSPSINNLLKNRGIEKLLTYKKQLD